MGGDQKREVPKAEVPPEGFSDGSWDRSERVQRLVRQSGADYSFLVSQNTKLLRALEDLQHRCSSLAQENSLLRRSCFPQTEEKVKHLKKKNAELAVIAKRLEERAQKLQEANLKVGDPRCLNVTEFHRLLRESQREVLRLQRQIALKNFRECVRASRSSSARSAAARPGPPFPVAEFHGCGLCEDGLLSPQPPKPQRLLAFIAPHFLQKMD
ncbi:PREDICTED: peripheral-type benzodiazepine receptor-associated protein 1-like [Chaetura pelagica]|uniref:peripheral-type benzodiazepine receptor-associated protein 1-like n=1 Tax=Chaetura pelagica TaxID=8897 RepID=UPI000523AAB2|nr:PREDICTED: peripheral-type benzodiazepine receptor-associated protein 1-like [Chaetura pelagica]